MGDPGPGFYPQGGREAHRDRKPGKTCSRPAGPETGQRNTTGVSKSPRCGAVILRQVLTHEHGTTTQVV